MKTFAIIRNTDKDPRGVVSKNVADYLTAKGGICYLLDDDEKLYEEVTARFFGLQRGSWTATFRFWA